MRKNYEAGGYGYGHAKTALYEKVLERFKKERILYNEYMADFDKIDAALAKGAQKARPIADAVIKRVRGKVGY